MERYPDLQQIAVIGNYLPRQCGIATFTTHLCEAMAAAAPQTEVFALPVNDIKEGYAYPPRVRFELAEKDLFSYHHAAEFLNIHNVDVVCVQHEYGIFGGVAGSYILSLLRDLHMPIVITLHTILLKPDANQRRVLDELAYLSSHLVVMSQRAATYLHDIYHIAPEKISLIPHGIPEIPSNVERYKKLIGVTGKKVLLTFGLLSSNKGIENVIQALPAILKEHPDVVYVVLGATHPNVKRHEGESYRLMLQRLARDKGVDHNVIFYNQFVTQEELITFIGATDIYITPYRNPAQIVSGTLAYVVGNGRVVISTPYWYAEELLAEDRGVLVPFDTPEAIAEHVIDLLSQEAKRHEISQRAYALGREMIWPQVGARYLELFHQIRTDRAYQSSSALAVKTLNEQPLELPLLRLTHLRRMTDDTGMLQHAIFAIPNYHEGYTTDDNARALIAATLLEDVDAKTSDLSSGLAERYLAFLWYAFNVDQNRFRNFLSYNRVWLEEQGSEDSHGRALWALGTVLGRSNNQSLRGVATHMFHRALPPVVEFTAPRAWAFTLLGIHEYLKRFSGDRVALQTREMLAERLMELYASAHTPDWLWFEDILSYDNARLSHALLLAGQGMGRDDMIEVGLTTLRWLVEIHYPDTEHLVPIGCYGFYRRGGERARFDQQPVEAHAMVSVCLAAYEITGDANWHKSAQQAFEWFLGRNDAHLPLYDVTTGGCWDGLQPGKVNQNQGAESTLAFLLSLLELQLSEVPIHPTPETISTSTLLSSSLEKTGVPAKVGTTLITSPGMTHPDEEKPVW